MSDWPALRRLTDARIGLDRTGASLATRPLLELRLAHARARDAVHTELSASAFTHAALQVSSRAADRRTYLMRPDLGRTLSPASAASLANHAGRYELAIMVGDGLSAEAVHRHAAPLLDALLPALAGWSLAPLVLARHARVALGDRVAEALGAGAILVLIGERPGLSAPDSLGAYLTWAPGPATIDAGRNCVSNIRPAGLGYAEAAYRLSHLLARARTLGSSGIVLKDESDPGAVSVAIPKPVWP